MNWAGLTIIQSSVAMAATILAVARTGRTSHRHMATTTAIGACVLMIFDRIVLVEDFLWEGALTGW
jgi:hypothetical protein